MLAEQERYLKNYADAEVAYSKCIEDAKRIQNCEIIIRAAIGRCINHLRQRSNPGVGFRKDVDELVAMISKIEERGITKANWYTRLAMEAIRSSDIEYFDKLADLANESDGGTTFARRFSLYLVAKTNGLYNRGNYIKIASKITDSGLKVVR